MVLARRSGFFAGLVSVVAASAIACGGDSPLEVPTPTTPATAVTTLTTTAPAPTATSAPQASPTQAATGPQEYTVQAGDTLGAIATQFGVTVEAIVEANSIADPNMILPGETLTIPAP